MTWRRRAIVVCACKDPATGKRVASPNPEPLWLIQDVPQLQILDQELWGAVKKRQAALEISDRSVKVRNALNDRHRSRYLLSALLVCGVCGAGYTLVGSNRCACADHVNRGTCSNRRTIARAVIDPPGTWESRPLISDRRAGAALARAQRAIDALSEGVPFLIVYYGSDGAGGWQTLDRPLRTLTTLDRFGLVECDGRTTVLRMLQVPELKCAIGFDDGFRLERGTRSIRKSGDNRSGSEQRRASFGLQLRQIRPGLPSHKRAHRQLGDHAFIVSP